MRYGQKLRKLISINKAIIQKSTVDNIKLKLRSYLIRDLLIIIDLIKNFSLIK